MNHCQPIARFCSSVLQACFATLFVPALAQAQALVLSIGLDGTVPVGTMGQAELLGPPSGAQIVFGSVDSTVAAVDPQSGRVRGIRPGVTMVTAIVLRGSERETVSTRLGVPSRRLHAADFSFPYKDRIRSTRVEQIGPNRFVINDIDQIGLGAAVRGNRFTIVFSGADPVEALESGTYAYSTDGRTWSPVHPLPGAAGAELNFGPIDADRFYLRSQIPISPEASDPHMEEWAKDPRKARLVVLP